MRLTRSWNLHGTRALVTGAGSGIGRGLVRALYARGVELVIADRDPAGLDETRRQFPGSRSHLLDVTDRAAVERLAEEVDDGRPLHMLFNNAGIGLPRAFEEQTPDDFDAQMAVNFHGVVAMTRAFLPMLRAAARADGHARLVNTSSLFGLMAPPDNTAYCASKFAVAGFSQSLAHELEGTGVGVSVVHPGGVATAIASNERVLARIPEGERAAHLETSAKLLTMPPERAGEIIVRGVERRRSRILVGSDAVQGDLLRRIAPVRYWRIAQALTPALRKD